jgi:ELWxxDGT repeat protein
MSHPIRSGTGLRFIFLVLSVFSISNVIHGQKISLVADINKSPLNYFTATNMFVLNDILYYEYNYHDPDGITIAFDGISAKLAYPFSTKYSYVINNHVFLVSDSGKLWEYDGVASPKILKIPGNNARIPTEFTGFQNKVFFALDDGIHGNELWIYDGINQPVLMDDIVPGISGSNPKNLRIFNSRLYFTGNESLWVYDGSERPKIDSLAGAIKSGLFTVANNRLYYVKYDELYGNELWQYDGLNPPALVTDIFPGIKSSDPANFIVFNNQLYFTAKDSVHLNAVWFHDGVNPPVISGDLEGMFDIYSESKFLGIDDGKLYFSKNYHELWEYDGVSSAQKVINTPGGDINYLFKFKGLLYFSGYHSHSGYWDYVYNGIDPPTLSNLGINLPSYPVYKTVFNDKLYFCADDSNTFSQLHLFVYDGINQPTRLSDTDIHGSREIFEFNKRLFVRGYGETYALDSTDALKEVISFSSLDQRIIFNNTIYFYARYNGGNGIYSFDGVHSPQFIVHTQYDFNHGIEAAIFDNKLVINAADSLHGVEPWEIDESNDAHRIADLLPGSAGSFPENFTIYKNKLYFTASDSASHTSLWAYDGASVPVKLADIYNGHLYAGLYVKNDTLYFWAPCCNSFYEYDGTGEPKLIVYSSKYDLPREKRELYYQDGIFRDDRTTPPRVLGTCDKSLLPQDLVIYNNKLYFSGYEDITGTELYSMDLPDTSQTVIACDSYNLNGHILTRSGIYYDTIPDHAGNDSIILLNLILGKSRAKATITTCDRFLSPSGKYSWTQSGIYTDTIPNAAGCDSIITLNLTINTSSAATITANACERFISPGGLQTWTESGTYTDTVPNSAGCDSIITLHLTVTHIDPSVIETDSGLVAAQENVFYQWMDCNTHTPIAGQVSQPLLTAVTGNYAVVVSKNGCVDTSACYAILPTGTGNEPFQKTALYPNPTKGSFTINLGEVMREVRIMISAPDGRKVYEENFRNTKMIKLNPDIPDGSYVINIFTGNNIKVFKLIKNNPDITVK